MTIVVAGTVELPAETRDQALAEGASPARRARVEL